MGSAERDPAPSWAALLLVLAVALAAGAALVRLGATWWALERWLYPIAVPVALGVALVRFRREPARVPGFRRPELLFAAGLGLLALGTASSGWHLAWCGLPLLLLGTAGLGWGEKAALRLWPAALLLLLAIPHPNAPTAPLIAAGKSAVGQAAAWLLTVAGFPVDLDGWVLRVGERELRLVDACSGARTQVAVLAVASVLLALRSGSRASRIALVGACLPAAFLASTLRVACVGAVLLGESVFWALPLHLGYEGAIHDLSGVLVVVPAVLLVVGAGRAVELLERERDRLAPPAAPLAALALPLPDLTAPRRPGALVLAALAALLVLPLGLRSPPPCPVEPPPLPNALLGEPGRASPAEEALQASLRPDRLQVREYGRAQGYRSVAFALHFHQLDAPWSAFEHSPDVCHSVSGWTTLRSERVQLRGGEVLRLELARGDLRRLAHAVYLAPGRPPTPSLLGAWTRSIADGALGRPNGATLVVLSSADLPRVTDAVRRREARGMEALLRHLEAPQP